MKILQILILIFSLSLFVNAQEKEKFFVLSGVIYDVEKSVISGADVTAENNFGRKFQTISDGKGIYKLSVPFGKYTIIFHKNGFKKSIYTNFENLFLPEKDLEVNLEITTCYDCGVLLSEEFNNEMNSENYDLQKKQNEVFLSGLVTDQFGAVITKARIKVGAISKT